VKKLYMYTFGKSYPGLFTYRKVEVIGEEERSYRVIPEDVTNYREYVSKDECFETLTDLHAHARDEYLARKRMLENNLRETMINFTNLMDEVIRENRRGYKS
jgi:hypothetical protein